MSRLSFSRPLDAQPGPGALLARALPAPGSPELRQLLFAMLEAHDQEEAAQKGEPSAWTLQEAREDMAWQMERLTAMQCAYEALLALTREP